MTTKRHRASRSLLGLKLLAAVVLFGTLLAVPASGAGRDEDRAATPALSPARLIALARATAVRTSTVHLSGNTVQKNGSEAVRVVFSGSSGRSTGTISEAFAYDGQRGVVAVRLTSSAIYCTGNPLGLTIGCGFTTAQAYRTEKRWVEVPRGTKTYRSLASGITLQPNLTGLLPRATASFVDLGTGRLAGAHVVELQGTPPSGLGFSNGSTETLFIASTGAHDLVRVVFISPIGQRTAETFTRFDVPIDVVAPVGAVALSSLG